jgi:hypothetical protein
MMKIKFLCDDPNIINYWSPVPAGNTPPSWVKNLTEPKEHYDFHEKQIQNIRACAPVEDLLSAGYIIPNSIELRVREKLINFKEEMTISSAKYIVKPELPDGGRPTPDVIGLYNQHECPIVNSDKKTRNYFKITSEWGVKTPPGYSCLVMQPYYLFENRFTIMPAIIDTDQFHNPIPIVGYLTGSKDVSIFPGEPLVQVIPFKRDDWQMEVENKYLPNKLKFFLNNGYNRLFRSKKKFT